jgi:hypothetical protein
MHRHLVLPYSLPCPAWESAMRRTVLLVAAALCALCAARTAGAAETIWIEAEYLDGVTGYCWPMGRPDMKKTNGNWGISGPGWAAEWTQGGESAFSSIACAADDDKAVATMNLEIPEAGRYHIWVRFRDVREATDRFQVRIEQQGAAPWNATYGEKAIVEEDNELKLYWNWAFGWEGHPANLKKGQAKLSLLSAFKEPDCRQVDCIVLTTDADYRPLIKDRPRNYTWELLDLWRNALPEDVEPLARNRPGLDVPPSWQPRTFRDKGFLYLWNIGNLNWLSDDPNRVLYPYHIGDKHVREAFEKQYGGKKDVPIFGDPRIVPTFHQTGPHILDPEGGPYKDNAAAFMRWLDADPNRLWATMMNYYPDNPVSAVARANYEKYRDRFVGRIAGESLGYFYVPPEKMADATAQARTRRHLAEAIGKASMAANAAKFRAVFGADIDHPYLETIPCQSVDGIAFFPLCYRWGARTVGYEASAITASLLGMRMAFLRGAARQNAGLTATYRSCNFGDSATMFCETQTYTKPANILDNFYDVFSGAGMTWYKMDIWYQYMSGSSMFYHEQGFDEFWMPGGTTAAGQHPLQLSPKGKLVDRFLRLTAAEPDRGAPYTPLAILVDYAHGWEPSPYQPFQFGNYANRPETTRYALHEQAMHELFWTVYHPIGPKSEEPITATNEVYVPGVFGDVFDVIYAYPEPERWMTIDTYAAVIVAGDIELTESEGRRLAKYVQDGGTLLAAEDQFKGPGAAALDLPKRGDWTEAVGMKWAGAEAVQPSQRYRFRPIEGGRALATAPDGGVLCAAFDRGKGRFIFVSAPYGLGIDRQALPVMARLTMQLRAGLMPVEVQGDVEWMLNRAKDSWLVTLLNPAGQAKPQHGITPTDFRQNRVVTIRARVPVKSARDRLLPDDVLKVTTEGGAATVTFVVPAGGVRIVELR